MKTIQLFHELENQLLAEEKSTPAARPQLPAHWWALYVESFCLTTLFLLYVPSVHLPSWQLASLSLLLSVAWSVLLVRALRHLPRRWLVAGIRVACGLLLLEILLPLLFVGTVLLAHAQGGLWADIYYDRLLSLFQQ